MHELLNAGDVDRLRAWSIELFATVGFDREVIGAGRVEPPSGLESAIADGFTDALVMPPVDWQQEHRAELAAAFAGSSGWGVPYVEVGDMAPVARPEGCYVLLLHPDSRTDDDLRGLSAPALRKALGADRCLTVTEYLVVQRAYFERHGDHRFDDYTAQQPGWMWLADSTDGARTAMAYWNGAKQRVEVTACKTGSKNPRKGARRCRIVALDAL